MQIDAIFQDRAEAGRQLADIVVRTVHDSTSLVLALPRGGVPVAFEVAQALHAPLDIFLVRKLGLPGHEELAIGAIASGGIRVLNEALIRELQLSPNIIEQITAREEVELKRREDLYRDGRAPSRVADRCIILIDDGLATGATMMAACRAVRAQHPKRLIVAVPVAASQTCDELRRYPDDLICAHTPAPFLAVGMWYRDFSQTSDEEVQRLLRLADQHTASP